MIAAVLASAAVVGLALWYWSNPSVSVVVTNETGQGLRRVLLNYTGGTARITGLASGEHKEISIVPRGESHIELEIWRADGSAERRIVDVYFEQGYRGKVEITLKPALAIHTREELLAR